MRPTQSICALALLATFASFSAPALAQETLKLAVGQRGLWDTSIAELGQRGGIFKKHGLDLDIVYTQGSGETQQAAISESVEVGVGVGIMGVLSAFSKGAPVRLIGTEIIGAGDLFWYVKADSPIKTLADVTNGKTIAYSTNGSSTHGVVTAFLKQYNLTAKPVCDRLSAPGTLTQVMSGQIDVGWAAPPFGLDLLDEGKIRLLSNGNGAHVFRGQTVRVLVSNAKAMTTRRAAIDKFMKGYRETIDWMYASPEALKVYAEFANVSEARAKKIRDDFFEKSALDPDKVVGLDIIMPDAVTLKYVQVPLTKEQLTRADPDSTALAPDPVQVRRHPRDRAAERHELGASHALCALLDDVARKTQQPAAHPLRLRGQTNLSDPLVVGAAPAFDQAVALHPAQRNDGGRLQQADALAQFALRQAVLFPEAAQEIPLSTRHAVRRDATLQQPLKGAVRIAHQEAETAGERELNIVPVAARRHAHSAACFVAAPVPSERQSVVFGTTPSNDEIAACGTRSGRPDRWPRRRPFPRGIDHHLAEFDHVVRGAEPLLVAVGDRAHALPHRDVRDSECLGCLWHCRASSPCGPADRGWRGCENCCSSHRHRCRPARR